MVADSQQSRGSVMIYHSLAKDGVVRKIGRRVLRLVRPYRDPRVQSGIEQLNPWQAGFCAWNAERLGISVADSERRYRASWKALPGGHGGAEFRSVCKTQMDVLSVIADDSPSEVYESYTLHSWLFLLRQISQPVPVWGDDHPVVRGLAAMPAPVIVDYGCGVAQSSIALALALRDKGAKPHLVLADIPTVRLDFVAWLCRRMNLSCETLACTREHPLPSFPPADVAIAVEIFEHLHDPLPALERLDAALRSGGFIVTNVDDHEPEFMHVSPNLHGLRERLAALGYDELGRYMLFRKELTQAGRGSETEAETVEPRESRAFQV
jgi:SAM-dependent methyltransferase